MHAQVNHDIFIWVHPDSIHKDGSFSVEFSTSPLLLKNRHPYWHKKYIIYTSLVVDIFVGMSLQKMEKKKLKSPTITTVRYRSNSNLKLFK